jgi:hypothetical protein
LDFDVWADADFAGGDSSMKSTSGVFTAIVARETSAEGTMSSFAPVAPVSKKQTAVSHSTPEAEIVAADHAMRTEALPMLDILDVLLGRKIVPTLHEDNETALGVILTGRTNAMRHLGRTHNVDIAWLSDGIKA